MKCKTCNHNKKDHAWDHFGQHLDQCKHFELEVTKTTRTKHMCSCMGFKK